MKARLQLLVLVGLWAALTCSAQVTWTGATDSSLTEATNWSPNVAITSSTDLIFGTPSANAQTINLPASADIHNLTFSSPDRPAYTFGGTATPTLTLHGDITVTDGSANDVSFAGSLRLTLAGGVHTVHLNAANDHLTLGSWINETGTASLTKTGAGGLQLSGDNTYTGGTLIEAGSVVVENASGSATGSGSVTIASGATLQIGIGQAGVGGATGSVGGAIINNGALVYYRSNDVTAANISGTGTVNQQGSGTLTFTGTSNTYDGGTYVYDNGTVVDANPGALPSDGGIAMHGGTLNIEFDETIKGLGDLVVDSDRKGGTVNLGSTATLTIAGAGSDFSGKIQGLGKLVIGTGAVQQLSGLLSTYSGGTTIRGGTLRISSDSNLGTAPSSPAAGVGHLGFDGGTLVATGSFTLHPNRGIAIDDGGATLQVEDSVALTYRGDIHGSGDLTKTGNGNLVLGGDTGGRSTFTGGLTVEQGTLTLGRSSYRDIETEEFESSPVGAGTLTLLGGTTLAATPESDGREDGILLFNNLYLGSNESHTVTIDTLLDSLTLSGDIGGDEGIGLRKTGDKTLKLDGASTFSGGLVVEEGAVLITRSSQTEGTMIAGPVGVGLLKMGDGTKLGAAGSGSLTLHNDIELGGEAGFGAQSDPLILAGNIVQGEGAGSLRIGGNVVLESTANTFTGPTSIECGTLRIFGDGSLGTAPIDATAGANHLTLTDGGLIANGTMTLAATRGIVLGGYGGTLTAPASTTFTVGGKITGSSTEATLRKAGAGTLVLSGTNTYAGWTKIEAGNLRASGTGALPATTALGMATGTKLYVDESQRISRFLGEIATEVEIAIGSGKTFTVAPTEDALSEGNAGEFSGLLSGAGAFELAGVSGSLLWLEGNLTYTGGTTIAADNTLKIAGAALTANMGALGHPITANGTLAFFRDEEADDLTVSGNITGSGRVVSYSGFTVLTGTGNNYSGGTEIKSGGVLVGAADGAFGASSGGIMVRDAGVVALMNGAHVSNPVTLESGSTIAGNGTFASNVIVGAGVTLKPELNDENTIGTLTFNELTLNGGGTYEWNVLNASVYDRVSVVNPTALHFEQNAAEAFTFKLIPLSAAGTIGPASGFTPGQTYTFELFQAATMDGFANFNYTIDHLLFDEYMGEATFSLSLSGSSILLNFTPVPEPSTWALLITGLAIVGVGALRRRSRR